MLISKKYLPQNKAIMRITIIQIGKTRRNYIKEGLNDYIKRLGPYAEIEIKTGKQSKMKNPELAKKEEEETILKLINRSFIIILDEIGHQFTSIELADEIQKYFNKGLSHLTFIIGGPYGLSDEIKKRADLSLSFSRFTFTHEIIRLLLLEQIYRVFMILNNKTYHY